MLRPSEAATAQTDQGGVAMPLCRRVERKVNRDVMSSILPGADDEAFMREALRLAAKANAADEVPIGAVVVRAGSVIGRAYNQVELLKDATAHAEMLALTQAQAAVGDWRLVDCDLYVTKEPCIMCAGALVHVRIRRVVFGCADPKSGGAGGLLNVVQHSALNHRCELISGVLQNDCAAILQDFFRKKRNLESEV
jgi:tRNA(adenine34) deaminase